MNGEIKEVTILEMAQGALQEQLVLETGKILRNILDPNTDPKATRSITVKLSFKPNEQRDSVAVDAKCESKPAPVKSAQTTLFIGYNGSTPTAVEYVKAQVAGQQDIEGGEVTENRLIRLA